MSPLDALLWIGVAVVAVVVGCVLWFIGAGMASVIREDRQRAGGER